MALVKEEMFSQPGVPESKVWQGPAEVYYVFVLKEVFVLKISLEMLG